LSWQPSGKGLRLEKHEKKYVLRFFGEGSMEKTKINIGKTKKTKNKKKNNMWRLFGEGPMEKTKKTLEKQKNHWKKTKKQRHIKWYTNGF
jgi:hypothetical protein